MSKKILFILLVIFLAVLVFAYYHSHLSPSDTSTAPENQRTEETGRPEESSLKTNQEKTSEENTAPLSFHFPEKIDARYISLQDWPPKVSFSPATRLDCPETDNSSSLPETVMKKNINGRTYCVHTKSEGAAGSVYTDYTYSTILNNQTASLNFTLRYPQCGNYSGPEKSACQKERETFNLDGFIGQIVENAN